MTSLPLPPGSDDASPASPRGDAARLDALRATGRIDGAPVAEPALDALARRVADELHVPSAFVSLLDADRDLYPGQSGFGAPLSATRQLEGRTFCDLTLSRGVAVVIDDTYRDPQYRSIPTVETLGVRAYIGVPLLLDGQVVGSLCAIDFDPRPWSEDDLDHLMALADDAVAVLKQPAVR